jgi:hypothetical protein
MGRASAGLALCLIASGVACSNVGEPETGGAPTVEALETPIDTTPTIIVTEPVLAVTGATTGASAAPSQTADAGVTYISARTGTYPGGEWAQITNMRSGTRLSTWLLNGGFDPVAVPAAVGDTIEVLITGAAELRRRILVIVPISMPPIIVRTDPPKRKRDVPIIIALSVVFSATDYRLVIQRGVRDFAGDSLELGDEIPFTTSAEVDTTQGELPAITALSAGSFSTCALRADGTVYCWGNNFDFHLGLWPGDSCTYGSGYGFGESPCILLPQRIPTERRFTELGAGYMGRCGLEGGTAYCWGRLTGDPARAVRVASEHSFVAIDEGCEARCALTAEGRAYCWGRNRDGQLGDGTTVNQPEPVPVAGDLNFVQISTGIRHACAITSEGAVYCWGGNHAGELGTGEVGPASSTPVAVAGGLEFTSVSAGGDHTCATTTAGELYCWGALGGPVPTQYATAGVLATRVKFTSAHAGLRFLCALTDEGDAYCTPRWGFREALELKPGGHRFTALTAGFMHACGLTDKGEVLCWGENTYGQVGTGSTGGAYSQPKLVTIPH